MADLDYVADRPSHGGITRRELLKKGAVLGLSLPAAAALLEACGSSTPSSTSSSPSRPPIGAEPNTLVDFTWVGDDDKHFWQGYAQEFPDAKVKFTFMTDDAQAFAKVMAGYRPDTIHPCSSGFFTKYAQAGVIQPWDTSLLKNFSNLSASMVKNGQYNGKQYEVPGEWGYTSILYRTDKVQPTEASWNLFYDERYTGRIAWWDSSDMLLIPAYIRGFSDPYNMSDAELETAKNDLISHKKVVRNMWTSETDMQNDFAAGNIWITYAWPPDWLAMKNKGLAVTYMEPKEGREVWYCGFVLVKDTKAYYHAHKYVDAWVSPESAVWGINNWAYGFSNTAIEMSKVDKNLVDLYHLTSPDPMSMGNVIIYKPVARPTQYSQAWDEVKAA
jgi:spermidine/putrescine transport system substrate-binding protein